MYILYFTAIGFTPGGSSTRLHTDDTQDTENGTYITIIKLGTSIQLKNLKLIWEERAVPRLCELYPGICLTTEEKAWINLS
jgi:hypothetical protein